MNLIDLLTVFLSYVVLTPATPLRTSNCHSSCQCSSQYYIYCQSANIDNRQFTDVISQISQDAVLLDLSSNNITGIPPNAFNSLPNLEYLYLAANSINELSDDVFQGLFKLKELTINGNKIAVMKSGSLNGLFGLKELNMAHNLVESLPVNVFRNLTALEKLQLQNNRIAELSQNQFWGLSSLQFLNISHNLLSTVIGFTFSGLISLKKLSMTDNNLSYFSLDAFKGLTHLTDLLLDRNNISDLIFMYGNDFYISLTFVSLTENNIASVPSHVFPHNANLKQIDLSCNIIRHIGGQSFSNLFLESLNFQTNNISDVSASIFKEAKRISNLNLAHNIIRAVSTGAFDSFRDNIIDLNLHSNKLTSVHPGMFRGMRRLRVLNLAENRIHEIDANAFKELVALHELNLSRNMFTSLSSEMIYGPRALRKLIIVCNPLQRLSGFKFENLDDKIFIESNSTMASSSPTSALITWPYKDGTQLYWTLSVHCVNNVACDVPPYASTLRPYVSEVTVTGLRPGAEYFICVSPVFLSSDVNISQCVQFRTQTQSVNEARHLSDSDTNASAVSSTSFTPSIWSQSPSNCFIMLLALLLSPRLFMN